MLNYEVFMLETGSYGYTISYDGTPFIYQTFAPGVGGFVPMTEEEARTYAQAQLKEFEEPVPEDPPVDPEPQPDPEATPA